MPGNAFLFYNWVTMGSSNLLVAMTQPIVEFKVRVYVESISKLLPKRRVLVMIVLFNSNIP